MHKQKKKIKKLFLNYNKKSIKINKSQNVGQWKLIKFYK